MNPETFTSPYPWPGPLREEDAPLFFGREEAAALAAAAASAHGFSILYGAPGVGKSSLLRAGVAARLNGRGDTLAVVFDRWNDPPLEGLRRALAEAATRFAGRKVSPDSRRDLSHHVAAASDATGRRVVLILDQFERYLRLHAADDPLSLQLPIMIRREELTAAVCLREDALSLLDRFEGELPGLFDSYRRLEHLTRDEARAVVTGPLDAWERLRGEHVTFKLAALKEILDDLHELHALHSLDTRAVKRDRRRPVRAEHLQAVLAALWAARARAKSRPIGPPTLRRIGGAARAAEEATRGSLGPGRSRPTSLMLNLVLTEDRDRATERIRQHLIETGHLDRHGEPTDKAWAPAGAKPRRGAEPGAIRARRGERAS